VTFFLQPSDATGQPAPATLPHRLCATLIDVLVFWIVLSGFVLWWGVRIGTGWYVGGMPAIGVLLFVPLYWLGVEAILGASVGKLLLGLRVLSLDHFDLTAAQSIKRFLAKCIEASFLWLPSCWLMATTPLRQSAGDIWAGTFVVTTTAWNQWRGDSGRESFRAWLSSFPKNAENAGRESESPSGAVHP
jgi:uncharacterized RDD family membrane protein YckC